MSKGRMEAFSDGVIAIIITIMVLELKAPHDSSPQSLMPLLTTFLSYMLSFLYVGIYWSNHHHLLMASRRVNGPVLWANLHLLFWLSLIPGVTDWLDNTDFGAAWPSAAYGFVLLMAGVAYYILTHALVKLHGDDSMLAHAVGRDYKGKVSVVLYLAGILLSFLNSYVACSLYLLVALLWLVPDQRIERTLPANEPAE